MRVVERHNQPRLACEFEAVTPGLTVARARIRKSPPSRDLIGVAAVVKRPQSWNLQHFSSMITRSLVTRKFGPTNARRQLRRESLFSRLFPFGLKVGAVRRHPQTPHTTAIHMPLSVHGNHHPPMSARVSDGFGWASLLRLCRGLLAISTGRRIAASTPVDAPPPPANRSTIKSSDPIITSPSSISPNTRMQKHGW